MNKAPAFWRGGEETGLEKGARGPGYFFPDPHPILLLKPTHQRYLQTYLGLPIPKPFQISLARQVVSWWLSSLVLSFCSLKCAKLVSSYWWSISFSAPRTDSDLSPIDNHLLSPVPFLSHFLWLLWYLYLFLLYCHFGRVTGWSRDKCTCSTHHVWPKVLQLFPWSFTQKILKRLTVHHEHTAINNNDAVFLQLSLLSFL